MNPIAYRRLHVIAGQRTFFEAFSFWHPFRCKGAVGKPVKQSLHILKNVPYNSHILQIG